MNSRKALAAILFATTAMVTAAVTAAWGGPDEGMWTYNNFPLDRVEKAYGFRPSKDWLDHLQLSSVRFNNGGSGSFVSANGLVMTNHHVGSDCIHENSSAEKDYMANGFYAAGREAEKQCPNLELNVLMGIQEVTPAVNAGITPGMDAGSRAAKQRENMAGIEKQCAAETGMRCDVTTLHEGGVFNLYRYKKYTDVRLVFAPEEHVAAFGGDPDNFNFPRYCLDMAFFRVYENGAAAKIGHFLRWSDSGPKEGEVGFVSGHPGSTGRQLTLAQLEFMRDQVYPARLGELERRLQALYAYAKSGSEQARIARDQILSLENAQKAFKGEYIGLKDSRLMAIKADREKAFRAKVAASAATEKEFGAAWEQIAQAQKTYASFYKRYRAVLSLGQSRYFILARYLVRMPVERAKPNGQRFREFRDSNLASLEMDLYSEAPIHDDLETLLLSQAFADLGRTDPAKSVVQGTRLREVAFRKQLAGGGAAAVEASDDPMIRLVRSLDDEARTLRKKYEDEVEGVERAAGSLLAKARFATEGTAVYPEATFTLRLSYGAITGYSENGKKVPYTTDFAGLYQRASGVDPYRLPKRWLDKKAAIKLQTGFNFVLAADITGGNSGSPVVDRKGELIGLIFDGNIQSLPNRFLYTETQARSVAVHSAGIIEALSSVYGAKELLAELKPAKAAASAGR